MKKYVLTIGGSDSSGGAGIQADTRAITSLGAHAFTAVTAVTAQNSLGVLVIHRVPARIVSAQIEAMLHDLVPDAVKIGMLLSVSTIKEVAGIIEGHKLSFVVLDPVLRASTGKTLIEPAALSVLKKVLLPMVSVVTPNLDEAQALAGKRVKNLKDMEEASKVISQNAFTHQKLIMGTCAVNLNCAWKSQIRGRRPACIPRTGRQPCR